MGNIPSTSPPPFGPLISKHYVVEPITRGDVVVGSTVFGLSLVFALTAAYFAFNRTRACRRPWRSAFVWMIWLENLASCILAIVVFFRIIKLYGPSFWMYMTILLSWSLQVQLLLQIIINRIRVILPDQKRGLRITIAVAVFITLINITVFCIWIPARLQISERYVHINDGWDRTEKVLFFLVDGSLNWYFIRVVKENLVKNGLQKYNRLVRFNEKIIVVSLSMDIMIIGAMSIPNTFIYLAFHPLAYLVKLNIEMFMANLIKKIALEKCSDNFSALYEFATSSFPDLRDKPVQPRRRSLLGMSFPSARGNQIRKTQEIWVHTAPRSDPGYSGRPQSQTSSQGFVDLRSINSNDLDLVLPSVSNSGSGTDIEQGSFKIQGDEEQILKYPEPVVKHW